MSRDQYRAKAEELKAKSQEDYSPIIRVARGPGRSVGRSGKSAQAPGATSPTSDSHDSRHSLRAGPTRSVRPGTELNNMVSVDSVIAMLDPRSVASAGRVSSAPGQCVSALPWYAERLLVPSQRIGTPS